MENSSIELCPICIEKSAEYFTECNHSFCIGCLCKIKKCAMCRKPLLREKLCKEIKMHNPKINISHLMKGLEELSMQLPNNWQPNFSNPERNAQYQAVISGYLTRTWTAEEYIQIVALSNEIFNDPTPNQEEEYDEYGRIINPPDEYHPMISYHGQFPSDPIQAPSRIPRWGEDDMWQTRDVYPVYPQNRRPRRMTPDIN